MTTAELTKRLHEVELASIELRTTVDFFKDQAAGFAKLQEEFRDAVAALDKGNALLTQRLDEHAKRFDRSEVNTEALLKDVAASKITNGDLQKRVESWEGRLWVGATALVSALIAAVLGLIIALIRK